MIEVAFNVGLKWDIDFHLLNRKRTSQNKVQVRASAPRWEGAESAQEKPGLQRDDAPAGEWGWVTVGL